MMEMWGRALCKGSCGRRVIAAALAALVAVSLVPIAPGTSFADEAAPAAPTVAGADFLQPTAEQWEVLRVDGLGEGSVFLDVDKVAGDTTQTLLKRQRYEGATAAQGLADRTQPEIAQIIGLTIPGTEGAPATPAAVMGSIDDHPTYRIAVYSAARAGKVLFEGTVYPVYAALAAADGSCQYVLLGIRTTDDPQAAKNFGAGETYYTAAEDSAAEGASSRTAYELVRTEGVDNRFDAERSCFIVDYRPVASDSISGSVVYVDTEGNVVRTVSVPGIVDEGKKAPIEKSFFVDGDYYRVIENLTGTEVTLTPACASRAVRVMKVDGLAAGAYEVTIRYVDQSGALLWSDELDVKGEGYQYTLPTAFSMRGTDGVNFYTLDTVAGRSGGTARQQAESPWGNPIKFDASVPADAFDVDAQGRRTLTLEAVYASSEVTKEATLTIVEVDGQTGAELGRVALPVTPDRTASYEPAARQVNGVNYVPWSGSADHIRCEWGDLQQGVDLLQYVYYLPEGYLPSESYDITVQYVNVADNTVLHTETMTVDPEFNDFVSIIGEPRIMRDGRAYVRLAGQETPIRHAYFSSARTYTIYYRDVDDDLSAPIVVNRTQIIETERTVAVPGTTVLTAAPVAVPAAPGDAGAAAPTAAPATVDAGVGAGDGATIINDDDNPLASPDGNDTTTERTIADNENPLAAPGGEEGAGALAPAVGFAVGAAVLAVAALIAFLWWRRRKAAAETEIA